MNRNSIIGGILAGGLSRRMGGPDKTLILLDNKTLISHVAKRLLVQVHSLIINANGDPDRFVELGIPVVRDIIEGYAGPLAGIHALMHFAKKQFPEITHIATVAADTPFFPSDYVEYCVECLSKESNPEETIVLAKSGKNRHPVFGLWPVSLRDNLEIFLNSVDTRKVMAFVEQNAFIYAEFPIIEIDTRSIDPFFNINEPDDLNEADTILKALEVMQTNMPGYQNK